MNTLGKRIAIAREKLGLNQSELARQIDVTPQAVQKIAFSVHEHTPISAWNTPHNTATPLISTPH